MKKLMQLVMGLAIYIVAIGPVWAATPPIIEPDQADMKFVPYPNTDEPETLVKGGMTRIFIYPKTAGEVVYYRILSVDGADKDAPIGTDDVALVKKKVSDSVSYYPPIEVTEDMLNVDGQFVVKAATKKADDTWSTNVTAAYNVTVITVAYPTTLAFEAPAQFMVGEQYEMKVDVEADEQTLAKYANTRVNFVVNWDGPVFDNVEYKFGENDAYTAVDKDDLNDLVRIAKRFDSLAAHGVYLRFTVARQRKGVEIADVLFGIVNGDNFIMNTALAYSPLKVPFVDRPAETPVFTPASGYVEKGSSVTIECATEGAAIRYTLDGSNPTATTGTLYENPLTINSLTTIKAVAVKEGDGSSFVSEAVYSVVGIPEVTPASGRAVFDSLVEITLNDTKDAAIYYTTDINTELTAATGKLYTEPFKLRDTVLKVIAVKDGDVSPVVMREYTLVPADPVASEPNNAKLEYGTKVTLSCATEGAEIYYMLGGNDQVTKKTGILYTEPIEIKESIGVKAIAYWGTNVSRQVRFNYTVALAAPEFSIPEGEVPVGARVALTSKSVAANTNSSKQINIAYTLDGSEPTKDSPRYTEPIEITEDVTIKAMTWTVWIQGLETSKVATATYTAVEAPEREPATLTFNPESGSTVDEGTEVTIEADQNVNIFYMMFESKEAAEAAEWDQEKAESYSELKPVLSAEKNTVKAAYAYSDVEAVTDAYFYATYTVKDKPVETVAKPEFSVAAGEVEKGTKVEITCATEGATIYYTTVDNGFDPTADSIEYTEPIEITEDVTVKAIAIKGEAQSEVAKVAYTVLVANEAEEELAGVTVYPNPSKGVFNLELPVAATVEVFAANGVLIQRLALNEGNATLTVNRSGIYFLRITGEGRTTVKRVIVR